MKLLLSRGWVGVGASLLLALQAGCSPESAPSSGNALSLDAVPQWELEEVHRIGSVADPDYGFSRVGAMASDDDGNLYVFEAADREIRVYSGTGELIRAIGGAGEGPGEFAGSAIRFGVVGDTVWAFDQRAGLLTLFESSGLAISSSRVERVTIPAHQAGRVRHIWPLSVDSDRLFVGERGMTSGSEAGGAARDTVVVPRVRFDASGRVVDTAGSYRTVATTVVTEFIDVGSSRYVIPRPPSREPVLISLPEGLIRLDQAVLEREATIRIARIDRGGDTVSSRYLGFEAKPFPRSMIEEAIERNTRGVGGLAIMTEAGMVMLERHPEDSVAARAALRRRIQWPAFQPPVRSHEVTADGSLWLLREDTGDGSNRWTVLNSIDEPIGEITLHDGVRVGLIKADTMWAVERDDFDIPWVVRYEIRRQRREVP